MYITADDKPKLLLLGAHRWRRQHVVEIAIKSGFDPVLLLYDQEKLPLELERIVAPSHVWRQASEAALSASDVARRLSAEANKWYVIGLDDYVCEFAAEISKWARRRTMPSRAAKETLQKHLLRRRWNELCKHDSTLCPVPFRLLRFADSDFASAVDQEEDSGFDEKAQFVVKPDALDASIGIHEAESWDQVEIAVSLLRTELGKVAQGGKSLGISVEPAIIIEHRIERSRRLHRGAEFSVEFVSVQSPRGHVCHHLIGITQKHVDLRTFAEIAHCFPAENFPTELVATVRNATRAMLAQLKVELCISHWEYIVCEDGRLALVEGQVRPAGDRIMELIARATDRDPYSTLFSALLKDTPLQAFSFTPKRVAAVFFPMPKHEACGKWSIVQQSTVEAPGDPAVFVDPGLYANSVCWGGTARWHSRYVSIVSQGATFEAAKAACAQSLERMRSYCQTLEMGNQDMPLVVAMEDWSENYEFGNSVVQ